MQSPASLRPTEARRLAWLTVGRWYRASWLATGITWDEWLEPVVLHVAEAVLGDGDATGPVERFGAVRSAAGVPASQAVADLGALLDHLGDRGPQRAALEAAVTRGWFAGRPEPGDRYASAEWVVTRVAGPNGAQRQGAPPMMVVVEVELDGLEPADAARAMCVAGALLEQWFSPQRPVRVATARLAVVVHGHPGLARILTGLRESAAHVPELAGVDLSAWLEPIEPIEPVEPVEPAAGGAKGMDATAVEAFVAALATAPPRNAANDTAVVERLAASLPPVVALPRPPGRRATTGVGVAAAILAGVGLAVGAGWQEPISGFDVAADHHAGAGSRGSQAVPALTMPGSEVGGVLWERIASLPAPASLAGVEEPPEPSGAPQGSEPVEAPAPAETPEAAETPEPSDAGDGAAPAAEVAGATQQRSTTTEAGRSPSSDDERTEAAPRATAAGSSSQPPGATPAERGNQRAERREARAERREARAERREARTERGARRGVRR